MIKLKYLRTGQQQNLQLRFYFWLHTSYRDLYIIFKKCISNAVLFIDVCRFCYHCYDLWKSGDPLSSLPNQAPQCSSTAWHNTPLRVGAPPDHHRAGSTNTWPIHGFRRAFSRVVPHGTHGKGKWEKEGRLERKMDEREEKREMTLLL